jgi:hypothetical protein
MEIKNEGREERWKEKKELKETRWEINKYENKERKKEVDMKLRK